MQSTALRALFYISESRIRGGEECAELAKLVEAAKQKNEALAITGALISSSHRFAQYIEGPAAAVHSLVASIAADARHENMLIAYDQLVPERQFGQWSLAYNGTSLYMWKHLEAIATSSGSGRQHHVIRAIRLIVGLAEPSPRVSLFR